MAEFALLGLWRDACLTMLSAGGPSEGSGLTDGEGTSAGLGTGKSVCLEEGRIYLALNDCGLEEVEVVAAALGVSPVVVAYLRRGWRSPGDSHHFPCDQVS